MLRHLCLLLLTALPAGAVELTPDQAARLDAAEIVILGEIHDNPHHHAGQAALLRAMDPAAVVFEMLSPEQAARVNDDRTDLPALGDRIGWEDAGWPDFALYLPVFEALGDAPVVGAALPREEVRRAFADGAAAVFGPGAARFGLDEVLPVAQRNARAEMQFDAHCGAMPMEMMPGMIEAQRLRDAAFSATALEALERYGAPVAVIAGNGHARRDWGMPALLAQGAPEVAVLSIGFTEGPEAPGRFDIALPTPAAARPDPCAAFETKD